MSAFLAWVVPVFRLPLGSPWPVAKKRGNRLERCLRFGILKGQWSKEKHIVNCSAYGVIPLKCLENFVVQKAGAETPDCGGPGFKSGSPLHPVSVTLTSSFTTKPASFLQDKQDNECKACSKVKDTLPGTQQVLINCSCSPSECFHKYLLD